VSANTGKILDPEITGITRGGIIGIIAIITGINILKKDTNRNY